ncbi:MAG: hypothetical protein ABL993_09615 [Vicinamibacterales bacterium]
MRASTLTTVWKRHMSSRAWPVWLGLGMLVVAGGLALAKHFGEGPAHLQSGGQVRTLYAAALAYAYGAVPVTGVALGVWVLLGVVWTRRLRAQRDHKTALAAVGVASAALLWVGWSTLPQLFVGYQHLMSTAHDGDRYQLGVRTALDGDDFFIVSRCPRGQVFCEAHGIAPVEPAERGDWSRIQLQPENATHTLSIHTPTRVIPVTLRLP